MMHRDRIAGTTLLITSILSVLIMQHHPQRFNDGPIIGLVHGALIGLIWIMTTCLLRIAMERGLGAWNVLMSITSLVAAGFANGIAGSINGFVTPSLLERLEGDSLQVVTALCWRLNQTAAMIGAVGVSLGMLLWSYRRDLLRQPWSTRLVAVTGIAGGVLSLGVLVVHHGELQVHAAMVLYAIQSLWHAMVGVDHMLQPTIHPSEGSVKE